MRNAPAIAAIAEAATGLALLFMPAQVGRLLFGTELAGVAVPVARVLGIALVALAIACGFGGAAVRGMIFYSGFVTLYLAWLGISGPWVGILLWPAVAAHAILTAALVRK